MERKDGGWIFVKGHSNTRGRGMGHTPIQLPRKQYGNGPGNATQKKKNKEGEKKGGGKKVLGRQKKQRKKSRDVPLKRSNPRERR